MWSKPLFKKFPQNRKSWMLVAKNDNKSNSYMYCVPTMTQGFVLGLSCALPLGSSLQIHYDPLKKLLSPFLLENKTSHKIWLNQVHIQSKHCSWDRMPGRLDSRSETLNTDLRNMLQNASNYLLSLLVVMLDVSEYSFLSFGLQFSNKNLLKSSIKIPKHMIHRYNGIFLTSLKITK